MEKKISIIVTISALADSGYVKVPFTGVAPLRSAPQTFLIGGLPRPRRSRSHA